MADVGFKPKSWYLSLPALLATKEVAYQVIPNKRQILSFTMWSVREGCSEKSPPVPSINQKSNLSSYNCITWSIMHASWWASLVAQTVKNLPATRETWVQSLGQEDPMEKGMATHSNVLAWRTLWTDEPGRLQSMGSQRVGHAWVTSFHFQGTYLTIS